MRTWRKVYATLLDSEQVSQVSDGAACLLTLLIVAQDDTGYWPWTPTKIRRLTTSRPSWTIEDAKHFAAELVAVGIARWESGGIVLTKGNELNGIPRTDMKAEVTPRNESVPACIESVPPRNEFVPLEQSRVDKSREEQSSLAIPQEAPKPAKKKKPKPEKPQGDPRTNVVMNRIQTEYGRPILHWPTHASEVKKMLAAGYTDDQIFNCWKAMRDEKKGWVRVSWVAEDIGDFVENGEKRPQKGQNNGRVRSGTSTAGNLPSLDGDNTEYYAKSIEVANYGEEWRKKNLPQTGT